MPIGAEGARTEAVGRGSTAACSADLACIAWTTRTELLLRDGKAHQGRLAVGAASLTDLLLKRRHSNGGDDGDDGQRDENLDQGEATMTLDTTENVAVETLRVLSGTLGFLSDRQRRHRVRVLAFDPAHKRAKVVHSAPDSIDGRSVFKLAQPIRYVFD